MSLLAFQQALCELIASPKLCLAARSNASEVLGRYELSQRERDRLSDIVWQRGMATNCTLYRSNRVTPIYTLLHYTCVMLGDRLGDTLDAYWADVELRDLEFKREIDRFAHFLKRMIAEGAIVDAFVEEVLDLEVALNELRFAPRRQILRRLGCAPDGSDGRLRMHPLTRILRFGHEPREILDAMAQGRAPRELPPKESFLLLSVVEERLEASELDTEVGRLLWRARDSGVSRDCAGLERLISSGLLRPALV